MTWVGRMVLIQWWLQGAFAGMRNVLDGDRGGCRCKDITIAEWYTENECFYTLDHMAQLKTEKSVKNVKANSEGAQGLSDAIRLKVNPRWQVT